VPNSGSMQVQTPTTFEDQPSFIWPEGYEVAENVSKSGDEWRKQPSAPIPANSLFANVETLRVDAFSHSVTEIIAGCVERGMQFPLVMVCVAINGNIIAGRYALADDDECLDMQILVEPRQDEMMELPINVMIVDARGGSARVMIADGRATFH
jgi:hypothetical protein